MSRAQGNIKGGEEGLEERGRVYHNVGRSYRGEVHEACSSKAMATLSLCRLIMMHVVIKQWPLFLYAG